MMFQEDEREGPDYENQAPRGTAHGKPVQENQYEDLDEESE